MSRAGWGSGYQQRQNAPGSRGGGGGGGFQSQNYQQGRGSNRFQTLSAHEEAEDNDRAFANYRGGRGGGRGRGRQPGGRGEAQMSWKEVVRFDGQSERPLWRLTCYAHERGGANDLLGDTSFEEMRWQTLQAARAGATPAQLRDQFDSAVRAKEQQWQALQQASRPPSKGGPEIPVPSAATPGGFGQAGGPFQRLSGGPFGQSQPAAAANPFQQQQQSAAGPFQQTAGPSPFGQQQTAAPAASPFGQPQSQPQQAAPFGQQGSPFGQQRQPVFGQPQSGGSPFGQQPAAGGFGGSGFGGVGGKIVFGSAATAPKAAGGLGPFQHGPFQQAAAAAPGPFQSGGAQGFGGAAAAAAPSLLGAAPAAAGAAPGFGFGGGQASPQQQLQQTGGFAHPFSSGGVGGVNAPAAGPFGQTPAPPQQAASAQTADSGAAASDDELAVWRSAAFERGNIPETAPPAAVCQR